MILISCRHWVPQYVRDEIKKKTGKTIDKFGKEITDTALKVEPEKKVRFSDKKQKTEQMFNKGYKPSGKFIYGKELLSTIRDTL